MRSVFQDLCRPYPLPGTLAEYLPDPSEPIDRWYQSDSSSNSRTSERLIRDLADAEVQTVVDPFCGAGSAAVAARRLGLSFVGMEVQPALAAVSTAKALAQTRHISEALRLSLHDPARLSSFLSRVNRDDRDARIVGALALTAAISEQRTGVKPETFLFEALNEVRNANDPGGSSNVIFGDALQASSWAGLTLSDVLIYTSPPFLISSTSTFHSGSDANVFGWSALQASTSAPQNLVDWGDPIDSRTAIGRVVQQVQSNVDAIQLIIEFADPDEQGSTCAELVEHLISACALEFTGVLRTERFSRSGTLYLLVANWSVA